MGIEEQFGIKIGIVIGIIREIGYGMVIWIEIRIWIGVKTVMWIGNAKGIWIPIGFGIGTGDFILHRD